MTEQHMLEPALSDQEFDDVALVEGAIALNLLIKPNINETWIAMTLENMLEELEQVLVHETDPQQKFAVFLRHFYHDFGFQGDADTFFASDNAFIDKVLERRKGIPVSLGAILLYLGERLGFPLQGVLFPTQFVLKLTWYGEKPLYINPFNGEYVSKSILRAWLIGQEGPTAKLKEADLKAADNSAVLGRWLAVLKGALLREEQYALALKCTDVALSFEPDDPYEVRDRGYIYQQLQCNQLAADDYQYFIDQCPRDPAAQLLKLQVNLLNSQTVTVH